MFYTNKVGGRAGYVKHWGNQSDTRTVLNNTGATVMAGSVVFVADGKATADRKGVIAFATSTALDTQYADGEAINIVSIVGGVEVVVPFSGTIAVGDIILVAPDGTLTTDSIEIGLASYIVVAVDSDQKLIRIAAKF